MATWCSGGIACHLMSIEPFEKAMWLLRAAKARINEEDLSSRCVLVACVRYTDPAASRACGCVGHQALLSRNCLISQMVCPRG